MRISDHRESSGIAVSILSCAIILTTVSFAEEMKNFARQWIDPVFQFSSLLFLVIIHISLLVAITVFLALQSWVIGLLCGIGLIIVVYIFLILVWYANKR